MYGVTRLVAFWLFVAFQLVGQTITSPTRSLTIGSDVCNLGSVDPNDPPYETTVRIFSTSGSIPFVAAAELATPWLQIQPTLGTVTPAGFTLTVKASPQRLKFGTQKGYVAIAPQSNTAQAIVITVTVKCFPTPTIFFEQENLEVSTQSGAQPSTHRVRLLTNEFPQSRPTDGIARFAISRRTPGAPYVWLPAAALTNQTGDTGQIQIGQSDFMSIRVDPGNLPAGEYIGYLSLKDTQAQQSSADLSVTLTVAPRPVTLQVSPSTLVFNGEAGGASPSPQTVRLTSTGESISAVVTPRPQSGSWLSVNGTTTALTVQTPADLVVSINTAGLGAGSYSGTIQLEPGGIAVGVQLVLSQSLRPVITSGGVQNGASFGGVISPGAWVTIRGANLAPDTIPGGRVWRGDEFVGGRLPTSLDNVRVSIDGKPAFVYFVSNAQINVLSASDIGSGNNVPVVVTTSRGSGTGVGVVQPAAPAFFRLGNTAVAARHGSDYAIVGDPAISPDFRPVRPGDTVLLYGTGFGPAQPNIPAGVLFSSPSTLPQQVQITIGGRVSLATGYLVSPGLYQINVAVPSDLPDGDHPVLAEYLGLRTQNDLRLFVRR